MIQAYEITLKSKRLVTKRGVFEKGFTKILAADSPDIGWYKNNSCFELKVVNVPEEMAGIVHAASTLKPAGTEAPPPEDIEVLELSEQANKALHKAGINNMLDLKAVASKEQLLEIKGIGEASADAILEALESLDNPEEDEESEGGEGGSKDPEGD